MPDNAVYTYAAYIAAAVLYGGYALSLWRRRRQLDRRQEAAARSAAGAEGPNTAGRVR